MLELARSSDWQTVNHLANQVNALHVIWRPDIHQSDAELFSQEYFQDAVRQRLLYVARINNAVVGYVILQIIKDITPGHISRKIMLVKEICVDEMCRSQGIGSEVMHEVRALAKVFGCTSIQLDVYPQNDEAIGFFQKAGLTIQSITMSTNL